MREPSPLVFLDLETTGLDPLRHEAWEAAWAFEDGDVESTFLDHKVGTIDGGAARTNGYFHRWPVGAARPNQKHPLEGIEYREWQLKQALTGATIVGANPAFDAAFLRHRWGAELWNFRLIDIEAYAMPILGFDRPRGLATIARTLTERFGVEIPEPDHTAAADVTTLRACWRLLTEIVDDILAVPK